MSPEERDPAYLWDIVNAARGAVDYLAGVSLQDFLSREHAITRDAVERKLEVIGEAARGVSEEFQAAHPEIPWRRIIAQRNVIAHEYGEILQERVWSVVSNEIPQLLKAIEPLIPPPPSA